MKETIQLDIELEKVKKDPQYIDYFSKLVSQKLGKNKIETERLLNDALAYFKDKEQSSLYGEFLCLQEKNYLVHGEFDKSIEIAKKAYTFFKTKEDRQGMIRSCNELLIGYMKKGDFESAAAYLVEGLELIQPEVDQRYHLVILMNTAELYIMMKEYARARQTCNEVMEMSACLTDEHLIFIESALLEICLRENKLEEAALHCQQAYTIISKFEDDFEYVGDLCKLLFLRAELNAKRALHMQAEKDYKASLEIAEKNDLLEYIVKNLTEWGAYLCTQGDVKEAKVKVKKAVEIADEMHSSYLLARAYEVLSEIYEANKKWEKAFRSMKQAKVYDEEIFNNKTYLWLEKLNQRNRVDEIATYKGLYTQMEQVAKIGRCFTSHLEENRIAEVLHKEVAKLLDVDVMGIAFYRDNTLEYNVYDLQEAWLDSSNDLTRYTSRLVEYCIEYQGNITINDGNFEEYSLKSIKNSQTDMKLQSAIVTVLKMENKVLGAMMIGSYKANAYSPNDLNTSWIIASYLAITLYNMKLYHEVAYLAEHDALTGLLSRRAVLKNGERLFKDNHKKHKNTAVIMFDIDYFKKVNDKYGHQLGDKVLKTIAEIMSTSINSTDYVGRYGGEAFLMILEDADHKKVAKVAERIKVQLESTTFETKKDKDIKVTLSGGIYICNEYTLNFEDAIRFADHALYRAKISGRNRILSYNLSDIKG